MMRLTARRGRLYPFLLLLVILALLVSLLVGVAYGDTAITVAAAVAPASETEGLSFTVSARDLGDFTASPPTIESPSAIVISTGSGKILFEHNANERRPMASTTKIMTAVLILESMNLTSPVVVSRKAAATIETVPFLKEGDVLPVGQLLYALMMRSANSAAVALAEACSGTVEAFVAEMNAKAAQLGMADTSFVNPSGLDADGHYSTAADIAILSRYAMQNDVFRDIAKTETYPLLLPNRPEPLLLENTNKLLGSFDWATGIKTGLTPKAEQCLAASGTKDGVSVISVLLGQPEPDVCWEESEALLEYGFSQYRFVTLLQEGTVVAEAPVPYKLDERVQLVTESAVAMELYKNDAVTATVVLDRNLVLPVAEEDTFGRVTLTVGGKLAETVNLVANESFEKPTLGEKIVYFCKRLGKWLTPD